MTELSNAEALSRLTEIWRWAVKRKRQYFAYQLATAILAFDMDRGNGSFDPPGNARGLEVELIKKPRRGRPPKKKSGGVAL